VVLLRVQPVLRDKQREIGVFDAERFDLRVKPRGDGLPHCKGPRPQDVAPADVVVGNHLGGQERLGVPV